MTALNVKYNNDKSRDFTNPSLPPGDPGSEVIASAGGLVNASDLLLIAARQRPTITGDRIGGIYIYLWVCLFSIQLYYVSRGVCTRRAIECVCALHQQQ